MSVNLAIKGLTKFVTLHTGCVDEQKYSHFQIHKIQHLVTICEKSHFEISRLPEQNLY